MSTVVITGAQGYIGTALTKRLLRDGHSLRLVSRAPRTSRLDASPDAHIDYVTADLRDRGAWSRLLDGADAVVHLSSRTDLRAAEADPQGDDDINITPIRALIAAADENTKANPVSVVFASTVTIVGPHPVLPVDETAPDAPCSVYERHKLICEMLLREATGHGTLRACTLRLSNVYGYGQLSINANRGILNIMINRAITGEPLTIYGTGAYTRDFTHLEDVVEAFRLAVVQPALCDGRHYVITTGQGVTLAGSYELVANAAQEFTGRRVEIRSIPEPADLHPIERRNFVGNSQLFAQRAGWRPRYDLKRGIQDYFARAIAERKTAHTQTGKPPNAAA
jgi:nucleoside-diphosphate-sugar epimerase